MGSSWVELRAGSLERRVCLKQLGETAGAAGRDRRDRPGEEGSIGGRLAPPTDCRRQNPGSLKRPLTASAAQAHILIWDVRSTGAPGASPNLFPSIL